MDDAAAVGIGHCFADALEAGEKLVQVRFIPLLQMEFGDRGLQGTGVRISLQKLTGRIRATRDHIPVEYRTYIDRTLSQLKVEVRESGFSERNVERPAAAVR